MRCLSKISCVLFAAGLGISSLAYSASFNWASQGDILTFDPHAQNETLNHTANSFIYEGLVRYNENGKVEPALAESWEVVPEGFLFTLRKGVKFHEGQILTPEDVVYSIKRANDPKSQLKVYLSGITDAVVQPDGKVLIKTNTLSPVILNQLVNLRVMNESWAREHGVLEPQNYIDKEESYSAAHTNGTGPFKLKSREVEVKTVFEKNPDWWDEANREGNVDISTYTPIKSAATRTAALLSGEVDFILDPPPQDLQRLRKAPNIKIMEKPETRNLMVQLDQLRDNSPYIKVDGKPTDKNPFKDIRVRQALYQAVDIETLKRNIMRGASSPTGTVVAQGVNGWTAKAAERLPYDVEKAKKLLAEAGYPNGFEFTLDTPNNRWINDEAICKALAAMWAKIGVKVNVNSMPRSQFFQKALNFNSSACLIGWSTATNDALMVIQPLLETNTDGANGYSNLGRFSDPEIDALIEKVKFEANPELRNKYIEEALILANHRAYVIPLHDQVLTWAMNNKVEMPQRGDNYVMLEKVKVK